MIKHIVMWKLKEDNKKENGLKIKQMLENLVGIINELKSAEVGVDIKIESESYDAILISTFNNKENLNAYKIHPEHIKISNFIKSIRIDRKVIDFEI